MGAAGLGTLLVSVEVPCSILPSPSPAPASQFYWGSGVEWWPLGLV